MKLIFLSNLPQFSFDLVKSSIFCAPSKPSCGWFATAYGESGLLNRRVSKTFSNLILSLGVPSLQNSIFTNNGFWLGRLWNLLYRWNRTRRDRRVTLINIVDFKGWRQSWFICWRPSGQRRMDSRIPEGGGCWQRTRTNSEWQTRRQYRSHE